MTKFFIHKVTGKLYRDAAGVYKGDDNLIGIAELVYDSIEAEREQARSEVHELQGIYRGETIHIIGTGPSLNDYAAKRDWSGLITIGVNTAPFAIKNLSYWLRLDPIDDRLNKFLRDPGTTQTIIREGCAVGQVELGSVRPHFQIRHSEEPLDRLMDGVYWANSSVQAAIDIARHMGAAEIVLWGVDYGTHNHFDNPKAAGEWERFPRIVAAFEKLYAHCKSHGVSIYNANPKSALRVFPFVDPTEPQPQEATPKFTDEAAIELLSQSGALIGSCLSSNSGVFVDTTAKLVEFQTAAGLVVKSFDDIAAIRHGKNFLKALEGVLEQIRSDDSPPKSN
jgi:hypothetical protein